MKMHFTATMGKTKKASCRIQVAWPTETRSELLGGLDQRMGIQGAWWDEKDRMYMVILERVQITSILSSRM